MTQPTFKGPIEGWTVNYTKGQFWRVEAMMEWADVMQDAYIVFMRCAARYPDLEPKHFMALYKRAWTNHVNDLSAHATRLRAFVSIHAKDESEDMAPAAELVGETDNAGYLATTLRQAPDEVRRVISLLLNAPQELVDVLLADWRTSGKRVNAALGLSPHIDPFKLVRDYLER